jgi:mannosylglycerate hydrolase
MEKKYKAHIISHTHWDREWYLNSKYTNQWLVPFFNNLFAMFEKERDYIFVLDGQMSMIEDFFEELNKSGVSTNIYRQKIRKYVKQERLFIGPYYLQPDWQLLSEESLVRNMLIGNQIASDLGGSMNVGWMMDNFGQISQTAQIHKEFGMKGLYVWRGVEMDPEDVQSEFLWESPDGTSIPSIYLLDSYRNVMRLAEYENIMKQRVFAEVNKLKPFTTTRNILLMNGYDQEMVPDDIQPFIKNGQMDSEDLSVFQSSPEKFLDDVMEEKPSHKTLKGSLYSGRFIAVFPGVMSARMYLKLQNDDQQKALEKRAEPLSTLVWALGGDYDGQLLTEAWKTLLKNHPHDSICGVSIDDVHTDMEERTRYVNQLSSSQVNQKLRELTALINTSDVEDEEVKVVFNTSFYKRDEVVTFGDKTFFVNLPPMGYKVIGKSSKPDTSLILDGHTAENSLIILSINSNGSFNIKYKNTGRVFKNLGIIEDRADTGDEYNYSHPDSDSIITTSGTKAEISISKESKLRVVFKIEIEMELPESDANNHTERSNVLRKLPIVTYLTLDVDSPVVKCRTVVRNTVKDHIMRVLFPTDILTDHSYAGSPFDITERPLHIDDYDESSIPEDVRKVIVGAREAKPNTIFLNREFVDLNDNISGLAVLSKGLPEYQVVDEDNKIALTLFRSVGWVAKDINSRIGDAGPLIYTPGAQCLREMSFEYAVHPHEGDVHKGNVCREADIFNSSVIRLTTDRHEGVLDKEKSFFSLTSESNSFKVTSCKRSEDGRSVIIRGYNSSETRIDVKLESFFRIQRACFTNLLEREKEELSVEGKIVSFKVASKKIITIKIDIDRMDFSPSLCSTDILEDDRVNEDFSNYKYSPSVTEEGLGNEKLRAEKMKGGLDNPMTARTALEAQLSAILTQNRINEIETKDLGYKLNEARVQRRVFDYIKEYEDPEVDL